MWSTVITDLNPLPEVFDVYICKFNKLNTVKGDQLVAK